MFSPTVRFLLAIIAIALGTIHFKNGNMGMFFLMILVLLLFLTGYFRNGTVRAAFQQLRRGKYEQAKKVLLQTRFPNYLAKSQKAYYYYVLGFIELYEKRNDDAFKSLSLALELGARTENDRSILTLNLANIELERGNFESASEFVEKTKAFKCSELILSELKKLEEKIPANHR